MNANAYSQLAMALDPVVMARAAGIEPDAWQARLLRSQASRVLLNCSRQSGKSTTVAELAVWSAFYEPAAPILLLSPGLRQSQELFRKCLDVYRALDRPFPASAESALRLELENGSRIISLPGTEATVRSFSGVKLLIIDEAARVEDALYMAVRPMLAVSGGRLVMLSSPFGTRGFFWEAWKQAMQQQRGKTLTDYRLGEHTLVTRTAAGDKVVQQLERQVHQVEWDYYEVPATECPRITPEFLEEEKETMGEWWFDQEYMCKFLDALTAAFRSEDIERIVKPGIEQWAL